MRSIDTYASAGPSERAGVRRWASIRLRRNLVTRDYEPVSGWWGPNLTGQAFGEAIHGNFERITYTARGKEWAE